LEHFLILEVESKFTSLFWRLWRYLSLSWAHIFTLNLQYWDRYRDNEWQVVIVSAHSFKIEGVGDELIWKKWADMNLNLIFSLLSHFFARNV